MDCLKKESKNLMEYDVKIADRISVTQKISAVVIHLMPCCGRKMQKG